MQQAAIKWRTLGSNMKDAWRIRAESLNARPRNDGRFESLPTAIEESNLKEYVLENLTSEWQQIVKVFKNMSTKRKSSNEDKRETSYMFGNERVIIGAQVYRLFYLSPLLSRTIFGSPLFSSLTWYELKYDTKKNVVIHIYSHRRIMELLTYGGLSAASFLHSNPESNFKYKICGKVNLKRTRDGKNVIGYIVDEHNENDMLDIKLYELIDPETGRDTVIKVKRPPYNREHGGYMYDADEENVPVGQIETYSLSQIWPTRIKINRTTGVSSIVCTIYTYNDEHTMVEHEDDDDSDSDSIMNKVVM